MNTEKTSQTYVYNIIIRRPIIVRTCLQKTNYEGSTGYNCGVLNVLRSE